MEESGAAAREESGAAAREESGVDSRRRNRRHIRRRRPPTPMEEAPVLRDPITEEEFRFLCCEVRRLRLRRSHSQSQASSSAAPPVRPGEIITMLDPDGDGALRGFTSRELTEYGRTRGRRRPGARSQAPSSSAAPRSDHPGATEGGTRVRQSVLYSDRPRRSRPRRQTPAEEHPGVVSSSELGGLVTDSPTFEALSLIDPPLLTPQTTDAEESDDDEVHPRTGAHVRQSLLYPDRPRRSRTRRPAPAEECTREESSSELGKAVIDLPTIETLSLSDPPLLNPQTEPDEETDDDWAEVPTAGQTVLYFNRPKGLSRSMVLSLADSLFITVSNDEEKRPKPYSDEETEEMLRRLYEYLDARPCIDLSVSSDESEAIEDVNLDSHAAELGTEPPSVLTEQTSVAAERHEASTAWMKEEVMLCFKKLIEISPDLAELENYHLHELCHQCFNVESYDKVYHHYNFTVRMKMPNSADWIVELYFAEVKEIFRTKHYLCYPLEPNENGQCYACKNQGVEDLRHPAIDLFEMGSPDASACNLWYTADD